MVAKDGAGLTSAYSNTASATVPDTTPPTAPASLTANVAGNAIALNWMASNDNVGVTEYVIERCAAGCAGGFTVLASGSTATVYTDVTAAPAISYSYRVMAKDAAGLSSAYSNTASATVPDTTPPTAPANLPANVAGRQINPH